VNVPVLAIARALVLVPVLAVARALVLVLALVLVCPRLVLAHRSDYGRRQARVH
jgi:hypothetical protein